MQWLFLKTTVSFALIDTQPLPDTIPLTARERALKQELESVVADGLDTFIKVGVALAELRGKRLYRTEYPTFEQYVRSKFGLARSSVDQLIRSTSTAESLIESGCVLPANVTEAVIRPIASLPGDNDLRSACWRLAESFVPERGPTTRLVAKLCSVVRECLDNPDQENSDQDSEHACQGFHRGPRPPGQEIPFSRPVARLAAWSGFSPSTIITGVNNLQGAASLYRSCGILADRCRLVQEGLAAAFPGVDDA